MRSNISSTQACSFQKFIGKALFYTFIMVLVVIGAKGCVVQAIKIPEYISGIMIVDGEHRAVLLTPSNEMLITKQIDNQIEAAIYLVKGIYATKYIPGLYHFKNDGSIPAGIRIYKDVQLALDAELELIGKSGLSFPDKGSKFSTKIIVFGDRVTIAGDDWERINIPAEDIELTKMAFESIKEGICKDSI